MNTQIILSIETATNACSAALNLSGTIKSKFVIAPRAHAELILGMVDALLTENDVKRSDISAIAFGQGPGSFMGVRLGVGITQGLAYGLGCDVIPVSSLAALAYMGNQKYPDAQYVLAGWDARMGEVYWGVYKVDSKYGVVVEVEDQVSKPQDVRLGGLDECVAVGNAWEVYREEFGEGVLGSISEVDGGVYPSAVGVGILGMARERVRVGLARPVYSRDSLILHPPTA